MIQTKEKILSVDKLSKTYPGDANPVAALRQVSFDLYEGEMLSIKGTSGSGKSTLLNILGCLDEPDSGSIRLRGLQQARLFREPEASAYRAENIGFVFQSYHLLKDLTVEENVALPLILQGVDPSAKVNEMLELVGLTKWKRHRPVQLSGGQQQRVAIARALITTPPIVLADEPTGNLDYRTSVEILNLFMLAKETLNQSMILVTHDPMVASHADRVLFFHDGSIVDHYPCRKHPSDVDEILAKFKTMMRNRP